MRYKTLTNGKDLLFEGKKLADYKLVNVYDNASAVSEIETELIFERIEDGKQVTDNRTFRLMYQDEDGNPIPRGYKKKRNGRLRLISEISSTSIFGKFGGVV